MVVSEGKKVRVRIAPSPTGFAHVGTAYAALFNYAFAKNKGGKLIIRLEDTDAKRHVKDAEQAIYNGLTWLGFSWDEGPDKGGEYAPYKQSERLEIYKEKAKELLEKDKAYEEDGAIRFKNPGEDVGWKDIVRGDVKFPGGEVTDFVIMKSDGYPTYNFAVVIDDLLMKVTHVIRGEEHISNTPRQLALYKALNEKAPEFAHLPTLRNKERKKLSKRKDPVDLRLYQKEGYLPEALVNFLCLLGWSHPEEKEIFSLDEFTKLFSLERVRKAGPIFDKDKLDWINGEYLRKIDNSKLVDNIWEFNNGKYSKGEIAKIAPLIKERIKTLSEFEALAGFFFEESKVDTKLLGKDYKEHIKVAVEVLEKVNEWNKENIDKTLLSCVKKNKFKTGKFFMDLRIAITGKKFTPPINDSIVILGKEETLKRLKRLIK
ncbi:glutamate--tRNA ligase [Candidatus Woesebacteria bacterium]|nr:MAG: glutamate--tRNA ligase [Candidatus Woesebacteria bacterium]